MYSPYGVGCPNGFPSEYSTIAAFEAVKGLGGIYGNLAILIVKAVLAFMS